MPSSLLARRWWVNFPESGYTDRSEERIAKPFATFELWCAGADYMRARLRTAWLHDLWLRGRHHVQAQREVARDAACTRVRPAKMQDISDCIGVQS
jgi:hypothetical protein